MPYQVIEGVWPSYDAAQQQKGECQLDARCACAHVTHVVIDAPSKF